MVPFFLLQKQSFRCCTEVGSVSRYGPEKSVMSYGPEKMGIHGQNARGQTLWYNLQNFKILKIKINLIVLDDTNTMRL